MFRDSIERLNSQLTESVEKNRFDLDQEMNLDTLRAYLKWKFPNRDETEDIIYSALLSELRHFELGDFGKVNDMLDRNLSGAEADELENPPLKIVGEETIPVRYTDVGIVRTCLRIQDAEFADHLYWRNQEEEQRGDE